MSNHARVYHGRHKGSTETHIPNDKTREAHDSIEWDSPQLCEVCWEKPCGCLRGRKDD